MGCGGKPTNGGLMKLEQVPTPAYVIDLAKLEENCSILQQVQEKTGCKGLGGEEDGKSLFNG